MYQRYRVVLTDQQRQELKAMLTTGGVPNRANTHIRILLKADAAPGAAAWSDEQISLAFDCSTRSVMRVRQAFVQHGLRAAVERKKQPPRPPRKIDGRLEAHVVALACSAPPDGSVRWTVRLLSDKLVEFGDDATISHESVRQILKKTNLHLG